MPEAAAPSEFPGPARRDPTFHSTADIDAIQGTILAFDFGEKRTGVAVGDTAVRVAHPLTTIAAAGADARFAAIAALLDEWQPAALAVGLPLHADGTPHALTARARRFARQLEGRFGFPVVLVDERYTSREAASLLHDAGLDARRQKPVRDQVAAQQILQSWFDGLAR